MDTTDISLSTLLEEPTLASLQVDRIVQRKIDSRGGSTRVTIPSEAVHQLEISTGTYGTWLIDTDHGLLVFLPRVLNHDRMG